MADRCRQLRARRLRKINHSGPTFGQRGTYRGSSAHGSSRHCFSIALPVCRRERNCGLRIARAGRRKTDCRCERALSARQRRQAARDGFRPARSQRRIRGGRERQHCHSAHTAGCSARPHHKRTSGKHRRRARTHAAAQSERQRSGDGVPALFHSRRGDEGGAISLRQRNDGAKRCRNRGWLFLSRQTRHGACDAQTRRQAHRDRCGCQRAGAPG